MNCTLPEVESFDLDGARIVRTVYLRNGSPRRSTVAVATPLRNELVPDSASYDQAWLRSGLPPSMPSRGEAIRIVDLFSGCGAMTLGIREAARALGLRFEAVLAADHDPSALSTYASNLRPSHVVGDDLEDVLDGSGTKRPTSRERALKNAVGDIDILVGGPPCQGHSDLNNHTRRRDPKNRLYAQMARFARIVRPKHVIVENVPAVVHDRSGVVDETRELFCRMGYRVTTMRLDAARFGVPQSRRRHFLIASTSDRLSDQALLQNYTTGPRSFDWACADLRRSVNGTVFDSPSAPTNRNKRRIDFLFREERFDLPDAMRPDCHRLKAHSYKSVYGRLWPDRPAPTLTTGFGSMGQGRYVHPWDKRVITPHEAARLQFIPDFFRFGTSGRVGLQRMIGNAVPPKLVYIIALELLR